MRRYLMTLTAAGACALAVPAFGQAPDSSNRDAINALDARLAALEARLESLARLAARVRTDAPPGAQTGVGHRGPFPAPRFNDLPPVALPPEPPQPAGAMRGPSRRAEVTPRTAPTAPRGIRPDRADRPARVRVTGPDHPVAAGSVPGSVPAVPGLGRRGAAGPRAQSGGAVGRGGGAGGPGVGGRAGGALGGRRGPRADSAPGPLGLSGGGVAAATPPQAPGPPAPPAPAAAPSGIGGGRAAAPGGGGRGVGRVRARAVPSPFAAPDVPLPPGPGAGVAAGPMDDDLMAVIQSLRDEVRELARRVAALEDRL